VALHPLQLVPQRDRHRLRRLLAVVVGANHHLLRPLRRPLAQLFLRLLQAAPIECAAARSQPRSWVGFSKRRRRTEDIQRVHFRRQSGIADPDVRLWHLADIDAGAENVCFGVKRTLCHAANMSANDPKRKSAGPASDRDDPL
jgi:hypothetical protein